MPIFSKVLTYFPKSHKIAMREGCLKDKSRKFITNCPSASFYFVLSIIIPLLSRGGGGDILRKIWDGAFSGMLPYKMKVNSLFQLICLKNEQKMCEFRKISRETS